MIAEALQSVLTQDAGMKSFLGLPTARPDRTNGVFPSLAIEQPSMPYLVVEQTSGLPLSVLMTGTGRLITERWKITAHGTTYKKAKAFAKYVRRFLLSVYGTVGDCQIQGAFCVNEADLAESFGKGTIFSTELLFDFTYVDLS